MSRSHARRPSAALTAVALSFCLTAACTGSERGGPASDSTIQAGETDASETAVATTDSASTSSADVDAALEYAQSLVPHYDLSVPGGVLLVDEGDVSGSFAFGDSQLHPQRSMHEADRFAVGSNTKTMVAVVVLQLVQEGVLALDDTIERWQPNLVEVGDKITIEDLLSHRSGLFDTVAHSDGTWDWGTDITDAKLHALLEHHLTDPPGTTSRYSNPNYLVLGKIVEAATHHSVARELQRRVFNPSGMATARLSPDLDREPHLARGYNDHDNDVTPGDFTGPWAAGGVVANADDLAAFYRALFTGALLPEATVDDMTTSRGAFPDGIEYGLGTFIAATDCGTAVGHFGDVAGYETAAFHDVATGRTVITLVNTSGPSGFDAVQGLTFRVLCYS